MAFYIVFVNYDGIFWVTINVFNNFRKDDTEYIFCKFSKLKCINSLKNFGPADTIVSLHSSVMQYTLTYIEGDET